MSVEPGTGKGSVRTRLVLNNIEIDRMLKGESGPVARNLIRRADLLLGAAKRQIRAGHVAAGFGTGGVNLRDTGYKRLQHGPNGDIQIIVGFNHPIALIHHEGTRPHIILPRKPGGVLVFPGTSGVVFAKRVHHPGTHPNRYLTDNLRIITD